jgi:hypothetical protein
LVPAVQLLKTGSQHPEPHVCGPHPASEPPIAGPHAPALQVSVPLQAMHAAPARPHLAVVGGSTQLPLSQQPAQFAAEHPPDAGTQAPAMHASEVRHALHSAPALPQAILLVPSRQAAVPAAMQPMQVNGAQLKPPPALSWQL